MGDHGTEEVEPTVEPLASVLSIKSQRSSLEPRRVQLRSGLTGAESSGRCFAMFLTFSDSHSFASTSFHGFHVSQHCKHSDRPGG